MNRKSLLDGNRDHLLTQARSELMKQEQKVESRNKIVSVSFSNKLMFNDWNWRTPITDTLNLDENKFDHEKD